MIGYHPLRFPEVESLSPFDDCPLLSPSNFLQYIPNWGELLLGNLPCIDRMRVLYILFFPHFGL